MKQFGILYHYASISKGLIDSRDLVYFFSVTGLMIVLTKKIKKKWNFLFSTQFLVQKWPLSNLA